VADEAQSLVRAVRQGPPAHYVRHNKVTRVPRNFIYFDSEARRELTRRGEVQTFRCAVAAHDRRRHDSDAWCRSDLAAFSDPAALWSWVSERCQVRARTVCVAHNLAYDLRITKALTELPALGWVLKAIRLDRGQAWCSWVREGRTLVMVDSMSWVPVALEKLAAMVEIPKLPLPAWDDSDEAWLARCTRDVEILGEVCRRLWDWVRRDDLGNWKPTGAGQAWAAYRHRFMAHKLLAHDDDECRMAERRAAWTGRCEVWVHGSPRGGPFHEWDFAAAYAHVGAQCEVPTKLVGLSARPTLEQWRSLSARFAVLAECTITTDTPTVPALVDDRICWPVGTFQTTIWENELALALDNGACATVHRLWWYRRAPALSKFCDWVLGLLGGGSTERDPVVVLAAKHWSRALVGRFGARWSEWAPVGRSPASELALGTVIDRSEATTWALLQVGHELKRKMLEYDSPDAVVAVMSWVMAECRVRLWHLCEAAGPEHVIYMDTDGVIVDRHGHERLLAAGIPNLRLKGSYATCEMLGPRQIVLSGALRASGVPKGSIKIGPQTWEGDVWTQLSTSLRKGTPDRVEVTKRRVRVAGKDARRDHLPGGRTAPRRLSA